MVRLDGWCELGHIRNAVEAAQQREKDKKEWRALVHMKMIEFHANIFFGPFLFSNRLPSFWRLNTLRGGWDVVT